jgi:aminoglycoside phosphotransferase (APT) family kinase protein
MGASLIQLPNLQTLTHSLSIIFHGHNSSEDQQITVLDRAPNPRTSTFPSEVVTCQLADGSQLRLLCKYAAGRNHNTYGHRGGLTYEAEVYHQVLEPLPVSTPTFYGTHKDATTGETWLVLRYFDKSLRVEDSPDPTVMQAAAGWLGRFHRANASHLSTDWLPFLNRHEVEYYLGWAERTSLFAGHLHQRYPWLATLCQRFEEVVDTLLDGPAIIIHGEYYPNNILFCQGTIYPVDWESTAVAVGEIDLASLIENWPEETARLCKAEYQAARWPGGPPPDFERKLEAVQFYWQFRWLGDRLAWTHQEQALKRFERLQVLGERFGLI